MTIRNRYGGHAMRGAALACALLAAACGEKPPESKPAAPKVVVPAPPPAPKAEAPAPAPAPKAPESSPQASADKALAARVKGAFGADPQLREEPIQVSASGGVVKLWGTVSSAALVRRAEKLAGAVPGVASVTSELAIVAGS